MTPLQIIQLRTPQWATDPRLSGSPNLFDLATQQTGSIFSSDNYPLAIALRVLHWFACEAQKGGNPGASVSSSGLGHTGRVSSETEGSLSKSFGDAGKSASRYAALSTTSYGCELIELTRSCGMFPRTRAMDSTGVEESVLPGYYNGPFSL